MAQNKDHTWGHLQQGSVTPAAAAEVTISGLAPGKYQIEQWDTTTGKVTGTTPYHSSDGRVVIVTPAELMGDVAYKVLTAQEASPMVTITPTVLTTLLKNPGMGMQTFYRTAETDANKGLIPLAAAYTRYYWGSVEPSQGDFSFAQIGNDYRAVRAQGQEYCTRIAAYDYTSAGPGWLRSMGVSGYMISEGRGGTPIWVPNMDDATVKAEFRRLVQALGARLDGQPGFGPIDIGSVGLWGEWHNWRAIISAINGDAPGSVGGEIPMPPLATCKWYVRSVLHLLPQDDQAHGRR